ncbi:YbhN family protein [Paenibacillus sp. NPDC058367]|uniref:lysylphosphatidylglycerol synthase transmembrane domain-containing protein n=1 Tax=Paenibacillus sp. NPDC058367 TaxID=3346460 RepID=UPI003657FC40
MNKKKLLYSALFCLGIIGVVMFVKWGFQDINYIYFILAFFTYSMVLVLRSLKMNSIINVYTKIKFKETVSLTASSQLMGAFIPGRAGELLISAYLKLKYTLDISKVLPVLFLDKIIELIFVLLYSIISIFFFNKQLFSFVTDKFKQINGKSQIFIILGAIFLAVLILLLLKKFFYLKFKKIISNIFQSLLIPFRNQKLGLTIISCSLLAIILEYTYLYLIFHAFNVEITLSKVIIAHSFGMIIGVISMIPGGQGSTEITMLTVLHILGYTTIVVISPILASKFLTYAILLIFAIPLLPYSISVLKQRKSHQLEGGK